MIGLILRVILLIVIGVGLYGAYKPLPKGLDLASSEYTVTDADVHFLRDTTYLNQGGQRQSDQQIFDEVLHMIDGAQEYILLDVFFYSDFLGTATTSYRQLAKEVTDALVAKKQQNPTITIQVITDPINTMYGGPYPEHFDRLRNAGITLIITDLRPLRDTNPLYSAFWRTFFRWIPNNLAAQYLPGLPNLLDPKKPLVPVNSYFDSINFKANHRKVVLTDYTHQGQSGMATLITSANPHDGSSAHTNTALKIDTHIWKDVVESERAVANFSHADFVAPSESLIERVTTAETKNTQNSNTITAQLLTERAVERKIVEQLDALEVGDTLDMAMFYLSDRHVIRALERAATRDSKIRLLLDPNKDAFGREKNGIPNRQVAHELLKEFPNNIQIRWCDTHGEQCHSKMLIFKHRDKYSLIQGSANLTSRNLDNLTLETDTYIEGTASTSAITAAQAFFNRSWNNEGNTYSADYSKYEDNSFLKMVWYRIGEFTGMSRY